MKHKYYTDTDVMSGDLLWSLVVDGGLAICKVCGLYEGALTTDCPEIPSYAQHADAVYHGREDFRDGEWVSECSPHSPEYYKGASNALTSKEKAELENDMHRGGHSKDEWI